MPATEGTASPKPVNANAALLLLLAINLFNYIDRQVLAAVEPEIRAELLPDAPEDEARFWMGLLSTAFLVSYMLLAPVFGWLADRWSRWLLVGIGVILWSLASGASGVSWGVGLAAAYWLLLITRCFVGVGEGAYGPIAPAMIADLYPVAKRGQVMAWFYAAIPVGGALGYTLGEVMMRQFGWREAFYAVVAPGVLLGVWAFCMREPPRGGTRTGAAPPPNPELPSQPSPPPKPAKPGLDQYLALLRIPSYVFNTLGMTAMTFAIGGLAYWMPDFLNVNQVPDIFGMGPRTFFGVITALSGLLATIAGGLLGDWLRPRFSGSYFLVSGIALILGFPMVVGFVFTPFPAAWIFVSLAVFCLFFNTGPTNTILANVTHPSVRASAFALNILVIHALGDAISPPIIGYVSGRFGQQTGFITVSTVMLVGGVFWLMGMRYLQRDTDRVETGS
ncbi:MAG: MFS transporter [Gemmataceae bacterium]|nr:MFS transporter [Gemmataceae bacterium]